jgi:hypothetical protein
MTLLLFLTFAPSAPSLFITLGIGVQNSNSQDAKGAKEEEKVLSSKPGDSWVFVVCGMSLNPNSINSDMFCFHAVV